MKDQIQLLSIHIPKTAGTSFYHVLKQVYPVGLSPSLRRRDITNLVGVSEKSTLELRQFNVVHGHITWPEAAQFCNKEETNIICWLRNPVDRVLSNYLFFINLLTQPALNPEIAAINAHRLNETPLEYAEREENRNRMTKFTAGLDLEDFFFIGLMEYFEEDLTHLAHLLEWPSFTLPHLNIGLKNEVFSPQIREEVAALNEKDLDLYQKVIALRANQPNSLPRHDA